MQTRTINAEAKTKQPRLLVSQALAKSDVFTISVIGAPGCGKTTLIDAAIARLSSDVRVGVIACAPTSRWEPDPSSWRNRCVVQLNAGEAGVLDVRHVYEVLDLMDLDSIDLLFIETAGSPTGAADHNFGQDATVAIFSVAAGDDKAQKHPGVVNGADVVLLNKVDLLGRVPFDLAAFRSDVNRLNDRAEVIELSVLHARGIETWHKWLRMRLNVAHPKNSHWFG